MTIAKLTIERELWLLKQIKPAPDVIVLVYAGGAWKEWKILWMGSKEEYLKENDWEKRAMQHWPSAQAVKVFIIEQKGDA